MITTAKPRRVDPARTRRYLQRTFPRPETSVVMTPEDQVAHQAWSDAFLRRNPILTTPYVVEWMNRVEAWCRAKGFRSTVMVDEQRPDGCKVISWEPIR
jgi:hypothetical protein